MVSLYKVTPAVDSTLKMFLTYKTTESSEEQNILKLHMLTMFTLMNGEEKKQFVKIDSILRSLFDSEKEVKFNTNFNSSCSVFGLDSDLEVTHMIMWSSKEKPLLDMLKLIKNNFDKYDLIKIEKKEDIWTWKTEGYEFTFDSEYKAYSDAITYMKSVETFCDCLEKQ